VYTTHTADSFLLSLLSVHINHQRKGIAKLLFGLVSQVLLTLYGNIRLQVNVVNVQKHLLDMYSYWGFQQCGTKSWEDVGVNTDFITVQSHFVVMEKRIHLPR
jgi:predicted GNAT family N-acyltransferase